MEALGNRKAPRGIMGRGDFLCQMALSSSQPTKLVSSLSLSSGAAGNSERRKWASTFLLFLWGLEWFPTLFSRP